jgi:enterochelin esterase-like enzyme
VPPLRLALLAPGTRDQWYSASPVYARELCGRILPALAEEVAVAGRPLGMGTSLGALAMLHAQRIYPYAFAGLFLQSGSFFVPEHDAHESGFVRYLRLVRAVQHILRNDPPGRPVPVALTCGAAEENAANNQLMARALSEQGYEISIELVPDLHNFTAWRDAFEPSLPRLIRQVWA